MTIKLLSQILNIESPTYQEKKISQFMLTLLKKETNPDKIYTKNDSLIVLYGTDKSKKTIGLVGHLDVVPDFFESYQQDGKLYGAGASDMKAGVSAFIDFILENQDQLCKTFNIVLILYTKEERTALTENGLHELIKAYPDVIKTIDCAIVGEPTDNTIQIGCVGSLHLSVSILGKACHSARPWHGENALYKSLPLIKKISDIKPKKVSQFGVDFYDVIEITESQSEAGRTSIPGAWTCNINYRFSPKSTEKDALSYIGKLLDDLKIDSLSYEVKDSVYAGKIVESDFLSNIINTFNQPVEAKQAWTDVAQLGQLNIPAFNFGPGNQSQAHQKNEYVTIKQYNDYCNLLKKLLD